MIKDLLNASYKWVKVFLALGVRKLSSSVAPIFGICINFPDKLMTVSLALLQPLPTTSLLLALNAFGGNSLGDSVVLNGEISGAAILLKPWIKR